MYNRCMINVVIVTRTKNRRTFLRRAIQSISQQTYIDYVHVIVNDGGDRGELEEVIDSLSTEQKQKTRVFHREESSNAPDTIFNESIDRVNSRYFAIHDDDDTWHPEFLERTVDYLQRHDELGAVVARTDKVSEVIDGASIKQIKKYPWMPDLKAVSIYRQCIDNQFTPISTLFSREAYLKVGKFDTELPVVGDWEFGVRLLMQFDAGFIDPGFSLANYHHRKRQGTSYDSVSSDEKHRYYTNLVMNRYLRKELSEGQLGVGYIMSQLKYKQTFIASSVKKLLPGGVVEHLKRRIGS